MKRFTWIAALGLAALLGGSSLVSTPFDSASAQTRPASLSSADPLQALSDRFEQIAARTLPAVVSIEAVKPPKTTTAGKSKPQEESGSGVIVKLETKPGYYVLTNNHVISGARNDQITIHM